MKALNILITLLLFFLANCSHQRQTPEKSVLIGKLIDEKSDTLFLTNIRDDNRYHSEMIPVNEDGSFVYELKRDPLEKFQLVFDEEFYAGYYLPISFYNDADTIKFELYPSDVAIKNQVAGGASLVQDKKFESDFNAVYLDKFDHLYAKLDSFRRLDDAIGMMSVRSEISDLKSEANSWRIQKIIDNPSLISLTKFYELMQKNSSSSLNIQRCENALEVLEKTYSNHPYTIASKNILEGLKMIKVGGSYIDFKAPDANDNEISISSVVNENRFTLIDLWAPWCGPCIKKSREIKKNYSALKLHDFEVIGVVGGIQTKDQFSKAIQRHNYPWQQLMEINDQNRIWEKYNISNSGGGQFLVDKKGKILAIDPDVAELKHFLKTL